jgi:hypothetical protein
MFGLAHLLPPDMGAVRTRDQHEGPAIRTSGWGQQAEQGAGVAYDITGPLNRDVSSRLQICSPAPLGGPLSNARPRHLPLHHFEPPI